MTTFGYLVLVQASISYVGSPHLPTCAPCPVPKWVPLSPGEQDWFPGHRDPNPTSGEPACQGPPWQGPFSWPSWLLPRPMVADISILTFSSIPPKTSGSARQPVSSRLCSTLPAMLQSKQMLPVARIDKRCTQQNIFKSNKIDWIIGVLHPHRGRSE